MRYNSKLETHSIRYFAAIALALAAQAARIPLHPPTIIPFITHAPFMVLSAWWGGLGPGAFATTSVARSVPVERLKRAGKETEKRKHGDNA
jgi:hypothetical protein